MPLTLVVNCLIARGNFWTTSEKLSPQHLHTSGVGLHSLYVSASLVHTFVDCLVPTVNLTKTVKL